MFHMCRFLNNRNKGRLLLVLVLAIIQFSIPVQAVTHENYPYSVGPGVYVQDDYGFYQCECTSYVAWCLNARNGISFSNSKKPGTNINLPTSISNYDFTTGSMYYGLWGHANNWKNAAEHLGITVDSTPKPGAVYWSWNGNIQNPGHVAWVSEVREDKTVIIEQYNVGNSHAFSSESFLAGSKGESYIHINDLPVKHQKPKSASPQKPKPTSKKLHIKYQTHVQNIGWQKYVRDGKTAGTTHKLLRLEGIRIALENKPYSGSIQYRTHIQNKGWEKNWKSNNKMSGTSHKRLRLEAIQIRLTGQMSKHYDVWYRVHAQNFGWMGWAKNGASAGTTGYAYRLEAIQIKLLKKGAKTPGSTLASFRKRTSAKTKKSDAKKAISYNVFKKGSLAFCNVVVYRHHRRIYMVNLKTSKKTILSNNVSYDGMQYKNGYLYFIENLSQNQLCRINTVTGGVAKLKLKNIGPDYVVGNNEIYYYNRNTRRIMKAKLNGTNKKNLNNIKLKVDRKESNANGYKLVHVGKEQIINGIIHFRIDRYLKKPNGKKIFLLRYYK